MNKNEYLAALSHALQALPDEERANAMRYYLEYFDDAGPENEQKVISELGDPQRVAQQILADYRDLATAPQGAAGPQQAAPRGRSGGQTLLLILLLVLASPIWVPILGTLALALLCLMGALLLVVLAVGIVLISIPLTLLLACVVMIGISFFILHHLPSFLLTFGAGLCTLSLGVLSTLLFIKLCVWCVPPICRGLIAVLRWPFDRLRGVKK